MLVGDLGLDPLHHGWPGGLVFVAGLADRVQPLLSQLLVGQELHRSAEHDVGASAGHVGGHGDRALVSGHRDDLGLVRVHLGVQDGVRDALLLHQGGEVLGLLDRDGADEHRLALLVTFGDVIDDCGVLGVLGAVDEVTLVEPDHRLVRRDGYDAEPVDLVELGGLGHRRTGHAGQLLVEPEVVLQGDGRESLVLLANLHALLGLDRLVQALVVATTGKHPTRVLVDDQDLAVHHDVLLVVPEELLGLDRVVHERDQRGVDRVVEVVDAEVVLDLGDAGLQDRDRALLLVGLVVDVLDHAAGDLRELVVPPDLVLGGARDDQRGASLVDQDRVDLVDDGVVVPSLDTVLDGVGHVVAQVVEPELVVGPVGDVAGVGDPAFGRQHRRQDDAGGEPQEVVDPPHPLRVVLGEVVVDRDDVHALAAQRVEVRRHRRNEGLALTGLHLRDVAEVQRCSTHDLDIEVPHADHPFGGLTDHGEGLGHDVVERLSVGESLLELRRHRLELAVAHLGEVVLDGGHSLGDRLEFAEDLSFADAEELVEDGRHGDELLGVLGRAVLRGPLYLAWKARATIQVSGA